MARLDPHSYCDDAQPQTDTVDWVARVDFASKTLTAVATLTFARSGSGPLDLDTRGLTIDRAETLDGRVVPFVVHTEDAVLGARLTLTLPEGTAGVRVAYRTSPEASALQWLEAAQTHGGVHPFLFSQCQAIHARSVLPLQDTPRVRVRYTAALTVPAQLKALMAAAFVSREVDGDLAVERWQMPQSIPPYLFAFAVGDLAGRELGPRCRVWAEPGVIDRAAFEFAGADAMLTTAEALFGPYPWDRFDFLTMPPSFPYGGMENPRLTFLTPTLLAGDRSLVNVLAHELAHSWTGNLVTNANAEHFWLNEGFTVYAERRIQEVLEGAERGALSEALGRESLDEAIKGFKARPALTHLRTDLTGIDPDDAYSQVPYEKGYLFLKTLERYVGRPAFDVYLRRYIETFAFRSITTDDFVRFTRAALPGALEAIDAPAWIEGPGVPSNAASGGSARLDALRALGTTPPADAVAGAWSPAEWQLWLQQCARTPDDVDCAALDARFDLSVSGNFEVLVAWLELGVLAGYVPAVPRACQLLSQVGRMKYLRPLYKALMVRPETRAVARSTFEACAPAYHPIARQVVRGLLSAP